MHKRTGSGLSILESSSHTTLQIIKKKVNMEFTALKRFETPGSKQNLETQIYVF